MTTSQKQIDANRKNSLKSTGPKTKKGKKTVSQNAVKHGLFARDIVVKSPHLNESQEEYDYLVQSLFDELFPFGALQEYLVRTMADCIWRSRRAVNAETAQIRKRLGELDTRAKYVSVMDYFPDKRDAGCAPEKDTEIQSFIKKMLARLDMVPTSDYAARIVSYQAQLDVELIRAFRMLMHLKKRGALGQLPPEIKKKIPDGKIVGRKKTRGDDKTKPI